MSKIDEFKDHIKVYINAGKQVAESPLGTARLVGWFSTLKKGADAGVTPEQFRAMFSDLHKYSNEKLEGFIEIGSDLVKGDVIIPQTIFEDPAGEPEKE